MHLFGEVLGHNGDEIGPLQLAPFVEPLDHEPNLGVHSEIHLAVVRYTSNLQSVFQLEHPKIIARFTVAVLFALLDAEQLLQHFIRMECLFLKRLSTKRFIFLHNHLVIPERYSSSSTPRARKDVSQHGEPPLVEQSLLLSGLHEDMPTANLLLLAFLHVHPVGELFSSTAVQAETEPADHFFAFGDAATVIHRCH